MPRGRHRHSPPLHRILPPVVVAGVPVLCAAGAWFLAEPLPLRALVAVTAAAAVTGACLMRGWDRAAGERVAELTRARAGDEWKAEERIAELETDLEESRELRTRLEAKLRRKRVELSGLRDEHAALLRRYANAETERASALEGRRRLAIEVSAPGGLLSVRSTPAPGAYLRAAQALQDLSRNAALQEARRAAGPGRQGDLAVRSVEQDTEGDGPEGKHAAVAGAGDHRRRPRTAVPAPQMSPARRPRAVPAASVVAPDAAARRHLVPQGSFDFFGTQKTDASIDSVQNEDLADVVGEEALAAHRTNAAGSRAVGKVIDLTTHDDTERLEAVELRSAISS